MRAQPQTVLVPSLVSLPSERVEEVFKARLEELAEHCYVDSKGVLMEVYDHHYHNGDAMERPYAWPDSPQGLRIQAVLNLRKALDLEAIVFEKDGGK